MKRKTPYNSTYPKVAVQWLSQALCYYQNLCLVDSELLRNRHLRVAANVSSKYMERITLIFSCIIFLLSNSCAQSDKNHMMKKFYKEEDSKKYYWEFWDLDSETLIFHKGEVGTT